MTDPEDVINRSVENLSAVISRDGGLEVPSSRRAFLRRASALSLAIPGMGAALTSCSPERDRQQRAIGLRDRGLEVTRPILVVLDGAKALRRAVTEVFDDEPGGTS